MKSKLDPSVEVEVTMSICKYKGEWFHTGWSTQSPMGYDAPVGPFDTFDEAVSDFMVNLKCYVDSFKEEENV